MIGRSYPSVNSPARRKDALHPGNATSIVSKIKPNNASPEVRRAQQNLAVISTPRSAVCSIALKVAVGSAMRGLFDFALANHRQHRISDHPVADLAVSFLETVEG